MTPMVGMVTIEAMRTDLIHALVAIVSVSSATACDGGKGICAHDAAGGGCYFDAGRGGTSGTTGAGGSVGAGGSKTADASTETGVSHGPAALSECFGASQDPQDCNQVCASTKQICVADGCDIGSSSGGVTFVGYKTGFQCDSRASTTSSHDGCGGGFYWDGENFMVVRCCCADSL